VASPVNPASARRRYHSPLRREQAAATRTRILDAALALFGQRGYTASSVRAIADAAGVSLQTLYQSWGSKPAIVEALLWRVKEQINLPALFAEMASGPRDPRQLLRQSALISRRYSEAGWDVLELVRQVSPEFPEIAAIWADGEAQRYRGQRDVIDWIAQAGALRPGLDPERAADTLWTVSSHDLYRLLTRQRGYDPGQYQAWLFETTAALLLTSPCASG
jgi:TetR/AcrR family transcriptional regulator, regulator of cefoperazone and chloramphenicol sensitivity